ncbi:MAG TPA: Holliday junction resolvase RuvX [Trueperaceae bacterium]|nr:Holliday junction resolvase RuvX [Trueperaceae bacterium]
MPAGRAVLALDVGDSRIGLARADEGSSIAFGRGAMTRFGTTKDVEQVAEAAAEEGAVIVVVGLPRNMDGSESQQTARVRAFAGALAQRLSRDGVEVVLEDERLTTRSAQRQIASSALPRGKRQERSRLDEAAAVLILESYLTKHGPES